MSTTEQSFQDMAALVLSQMESLPPEERKACLAEALQHVAAESAESATRILLSIAASVEQPEYLS